MSEEQLIAEAILQLKQESNVIKDYIFPIAMALFSSFIGALAGYFVYLRQEKMAIEKRKLDIVNKWLMMAYQMHQQLIGIKEHYHRNLNTNPISRALSVPTILREHKTYSFEYYELAFMASSKDSNKYNLGKLGLIFDNYENLLVILNKRNEVNEEFKKQLLGIMGICSAVTTVSEKDILNNNDPVLLSVLIDLTEFVLRYTDDLVIQLYNFLNEFPPEARKQIKLKNLKNYGGLLNFDLKSNSYIQELLKEAPLPNLKKIAEISGRTEEELMTRYKPLFNSKNNG